eukprot:CAMPEP_0195058442 /NCGR_PEP_ID=MMETSP0448-20130528/6292_1 /TAXON_ID=66468 /ORGANISM="Heterocapsa triquestra, Strain CCMP 448" /LENGTH=60 /DNA_ID=CAMNT_0040088593 /DNA_START=430 /DNA_END=610 /DNA_ORIENTATION=-
MATAVTFTAMLHEGRGKMTTMAKAGGTRPPPQALLQQEGLGTDSTRSKVTLPGRAELEPD